MVHIKQLIPQSDVSEVVAKRPSLLCMEVSFHNAISMVRLSMLSLLLHARAHAGCICCKVTYLPTSWYSHADRGPST